MYTINNLSKSLIMENNKLIKGFIRNFSGGKDDEDDFAKLCHAIDCNKLGVPTELQTKIDDFIQCELAPMVYEPETAFTEAFSIGTVVDGVYHLATNEDGRKMCAAFLKVLLETEERWDKFAETELKPYLLAE